MAQLRHDPINIEGWVQKEGRLLRGKNRRFMRLRGAILSNHHSEDAPASWEVSVLECHVSPGGRPREVVISLPNRKVSFSVESDEDFKSWTSALKRASASSVEDFYQLGRVLGEGAFAQVRLGVDKETGERFAIKVIKKKEYDPKEMDLLLREVSILRSVAHENIVTTHDVFNTKDRLHLVLEFMEGGELFDIIADRGSFTEQMASQVTREVVQGVQYLHMHSIVHRDLKPENVLCTTKEWPLGVKLADFGLANYAEDGTIREAASNMVGTPGYVAPEVVKREQYGPPVDMWACGVLLYIMLSGKMPFYGRDDNECLRRIAAGKYDMPDREWRNISEDAKSLVKSLLQTDPDKRLTANAALQHKWLADPDSQSDTPIANDLKGIHSSRRKWKKVVMAAVTVERMKDIMNKNAASGSIGSPVSAMSAVSAGAAAGASESPSSTDPSGSSGDAVAPANKPVGPVASSI